MKFTRSTAHKLWIGDLLGGTFTKGEGEFDPSYLSIRGNQVSRVNIVGIIVDKGDTDNMMSFSLDDGSANISLRIWGDDRSIAEGINVGDVVLVLGRIRVYNEVRYVLIEVIRKVTASWAKLRRMELNKIYGDPIKVEKFDVDDVNSGPPQEVVSEDVVTEEVAGDVNEARGKIISLIESHDQGDGVDMEFLIKESAIENAEGVIQGLLKDGEVFEVQMGKLRILP